MCDRFFKARGPILSNQSIELNKLNIFLSICVKRIFTSKKLWKLSKVIKMFKNLFDFFRRFSGPGELRRFWSDKIEKMRPWGQSHLFYMHRKFQLHSFLRYPIHNRGIFAHFSQHLTHIVLIKKVLRKIRTNNLD